MLKTYSILAKKNQSHLPKTTPLLPEETANLKMMETSLLRKISQVTKNPKLYRFNRYSLLKKLCKMKYKKCKKCKKQKTYNKKKKKNKKIHRAENKTKTPHSPKDPKNLKYPSEISHNLYLLIKTKTPPEAEALKTAPLLLFLQSSETLTPELSRTLKNSLKPPTTLKNLWTLLLTPKNFGTSI